jgi:enamine deaminase RidA (YjgF/YER057c/UK114 family)
MEVSSDESIASRRNFVTAAIALGMAGTAEAAAAQTPQAAPPASTTVQVSALADPRYMIEVEATAILPQRG